MFHRFSSTIYDDPTAVFPPFGYSNALVDENTPLVAPSSPQYSSSLPSYYYIQRSSSSNSLSDPNPLLDTTGINYPFSSSADFLDFHDEPVRRVFSTGDLQSSIENDGGSSSTRVGRYSAEERKERIERYRSKRNHRNFHKKITYACRKTLADSRPRIRGRFARNGEMDAEAEIETDGNAENGDWWMQMLGTTDEDEDIFGVFSVKLLS